MPYVNTRQIKQDVLFRAAEVTGGASDYDEKVIDYINRTYKTMASGASEFLPEYVDDWWWLRARGVLTLKPVLVGTVTVTQDSAAIVFDSGPVDSVVDYRIRFDNWGEVFRITSHVAGSVDAVLDSPFTGPTVASNAYRLMKVTYELDAAVAAITGPMVGFRDNPKINGVSPERMDELYPLPQLMPGVPTGFALEDIQTVRFSHGGRTDGYSMRVEYPYRPKVLDLEDSDTSIPLVPEEWRHILADMALTYVYLDKNDDRSNAVALAARTGLAGMLKENRRRLSKMNKNTGQIYPRSNSLGQPAVPLRTESGLIISG